MTFYLLFLLILSVSLIVWLTAYKKVNAFFALLLGALGVGLLSGLPLGDVVSSLKAGFGHTMEKIGLLIILGTALGIILEKTGATMAMANAILKRVSDAHAPAAISITGFIIGLPIFCDSGFIILSGLNHSLVKRTQIGMPIMAAALGTALYSVHCLVPPHPGITAAVGTMGGDVGKVMLLGIVLAIPAAAIGYWWSLYQGRKTEHQVTADNKEIQVDSNLPQAWLSFLPVLLPIALIGLKSIIMLYSNPENSGSIGYQIISFIGEPVIALMIALVISFLLIRKSHKSDMNHWLTEGIEKAGIVLAIIAGGGMFGEMLQSTGVGKNLGLLMSGFSLGIFFPFLITAILKTAQGSSTVAIITAASLVAPLLKDLGLDSPSGTTLAILSMGAGSMVISHANDAYFWVISKFSGLETSTALKVYSVATLMMGMAVQLILWLINFFF